MTGLDATTEGTMEPTVDVFEIGDTIDTGDDRGEIDSIDGDQVTVRWESGVTTTQHWEVLWNRAEAIWGRTA